ncbi:hypothetical protein [Xenorhabdus sp. PB30.3]|uniref:hypothetical protein n=1 Tax=Xenorhabdus sp. PB30.3 TaxID=2788941 RepID=UPI001E542CBD|nr:hypothetical protein [Xenorhabdus sp. PB30.3]MCC8380406.1 hypothetical protein [Xenorhabdus sp. PB30.3]
MSPIKQSVKVFTPLENTDGQGFAPLRKCPAGRNFYQRVCLRPFNGDSDWGGFGLAGWVFSGSANPVWIATININ